MGETILISMCNVIPHAVGHTRVHTRVRRFTNNNRNGKRAATLRDYRPQNQSPDHQNVPNRTEYPRPRIYFPFPLQLFPRPVMLVDVCETPTPASLSFGGTSNANFFAVRFSCRVCHEQPPSGEDSTLESRESTCCL